MLVTKYLIMSSESNILPSDIAMKIYGSGYDILVKETCFGVIIHGDSMEPDYHNGQIVWIHQQAKLEHGDVGVFTYERSTYFKRLRDRVGGTRLQSVDSSYPDIIVTGPEAMITLGKVAE